MGIWPSSLLNAMWIFYICALLPVLAGLIFLWKDNEVSWQEWLLGAASAFILAAILHACALWGMTADIETWSGQVVKVSHHPRWVECYIESHSETTTDSDGNTHTRYWTTTEYDTHPEHWAATRDFGTYTDDPNIEENLFNEMSQRFGSKLFTDGTQSSDHFGGTSSSGDDNIYSVNDETGYVYPVTMTRHFENKIKAAPTVFSFTQVPTNIAVYPWPVNSDWLHSDRLCGTASALVNLYKWDCMNASLGPTKRVNVILVGFGEGVSDDYAHYQQAKWIGGKKNDLVICFGGATRTQPAKWVYVFGWTESELVKQNLQSLLMEHPINDDIIPLVSQEIAKNYVIKDWHKFDYITIDPPTWSYWVYFISMLIIQVGLYIWFQLNDLRKDSSNISFYGFNTRRWRY